MPEFVLCWQAAASELTLRTTKPPRQTDSDTDTDAATKVLSCDK